MRHAQVEISRLSLWSGYDPSIWALSPFLGYKRETQSVKLAFSVGPVYVGAAMWIGRLEEHPCPAGDDCAMNKGAVMCKHCGRHWPPDETWDQP